MKDPKISKLVQQFEKEVAAVNKTWAALHNNNVFVRASIKGMSSYTESKYIDIEQITQSVEYMKGDK